MNSKKYSLKKQNSEKMQISIGSFTLTITGALVVGIIGTLYVSYLFYRESQAISLFLLLIITPILLVLLCYFIYSIVEYEKEIPPWNR
jgi:phosphate/sulfate permease